MKANKGAFIVKILLWVQLTVLLLVLSLFVANYIIADGIYYPWIGWVHLKVKDNTLERVYYTLHHELGHHIWFNCLTNSQKTEYIKLYRELYKETCEILPSVVEDFADSLSKYEMLYWLCEAKTQYFSKLNPQCK